jgi:tetratricopeptide (TPR) repeat protein
VSSVAGRYSARPRPAGSGTAARALARVATADVAVTLGVAAALALLAFVAQGGVAIEPNTWAEVALVAVGGLIGAVALAAPARHARPAPLHGALALAGFGLLTLFTALSIVWSLAPSDSWLETNRTFAYLAAFVAGLGLVRLMPGRWGAVLQGIALGCLIVCGYALLTKVFPQSLAEDEIFARLRAPFGYWNAVGLMAALGIPPLLWLGARRSGHAPANALAYPAIGLLLVCLMLSYSRGALLALLIGLAAWFALVPLRLRAATVLGVSAAGAALVTAWAFGQDGLTQDRLPGYARAHAGHELGLLLVLLAVVLLAAGLAIGFASTRWSPPERTRVLAGRILVGAVAVAAVIGAISVSGSLGQLTDPNARTPANTPNRLTATSSVRARYWSEAFKVHAESPWIGAGAGAYGTVRKRFRTSDIDVQHAHGYTVQVLADLGWTGLLVSLAALAAWLAAAASALGLRRTDRGLPWDAERVGLATLAAVVLVFGVHSFIDWTWFVPANAVAGLLAAGWVAGRGPLRARLAAEGPTGIIPAAVRAGLVTERRRWSLREHLTRWRPDPYRTALAAGVLVGGMAVSWAIVQPLRAVHAGDAAIARLTENAYDAASDIAFIGTKRNPLSVEPWWELATAEASAGKPDLAERALEKAVAVQPANAEAWRRLGRFRLSALGQAGPALEAFRAAYHLDPQSPDSMSDVLEASRAVAAG